MDVIHLADNVTENAVLGKAKPTKSKSYKFYRPLTEQVMVDRMIRRESPAEVEVEYEFSRDPGLLHQYYILRENMFINVWGLKSFTGHEDSHDRYSHILLARQANHVVGGIRITVKSQRPSRKLPMEADDFILEKAVADMNLKDCRYGEKSRFAILSDIRSKEVSVSLTGHVKEKCVELGLKYVFAMCPLSLARSYRLLAKVHGVECYLREDVVIPDREEFEGIPMVLLVFDYSKQLAENDQSDKNTSKELEAL